MDVAIGMLLMILKAIWPYALIGIGFACLGWVIGDVVEKAVARGIVQGLQSFDIKTAIAEGVILAKDLTTETNDELV